MLLAVIMEKKLAINTGHTIQVRRTLDEAVQEILAEQKYPEDVYWGNIKLVLMFFLRLNDEYSQHDADMLLLTIVPLFVKGSKYPTFLTA